MSKKPDHSPLKWVAAALFSSVFVCGLSLYIASGAQDWNGDVSVLSLKNLDPNVESTEDESEVILSAEDLPIPSGDYLQTAPQNMRLGVTPGEISTKLNTGTHAEVYSFSISSNYAYTLRNIPFELYGEGFSSAFYEASTWELYAETVNGAELVGTGESFEDELLRMRLVGEWPHAYFGPPEQVEFTLVGAIEIIEEDAWLRVQIVEDEGLGWQWIPGHYQGSWLNPEGVLGSEQIDGLPGVRLERH